MFAEMPEPFSLIELAQLDALGETTSEQQAALCVACQRDPALAREHWCLVADSRLIICALATDVRSGEPISPMPPHILARLEKNRLSLLTESQVEQTSGSEQFIPVPKDTAVLMEAGNQDIVAWVTINASRANWMQWLKSAAVVAIFAGLAGFFLFSPKKPQSAVLTFSPMGETGLKQPVLVWENKSNQLYDVWILPPEGDAATVAPLFVAFSELKPKTEVNDLRAGFDYRLLVCLNIEGNPNRLVGVATPFRVTEGATTEVPAPMTAEAALPVLRRLVELRSPGDAVAVFAALPDALRARPKLVTYEADIRDQLRKEQVR